MLFSRLALLATAVTVAAGAGSPPARADEAVVPSIAAPPVAPPAADSGAGGLGLYAGAGVLGSPSTIGTDVAVGLRLRLAHYLAANLDTGYGVVGSPGVAQDRWWVIPGAAMVIPLGKLTLDLGGGVGAGTTSGYTSWPGYVAAPFDPIWHHTVPAAQVQAALTAPLTSQVDLMARAQAGTLLGVPHLNAGDGTWMGITLGIQAQLL